MKRAPLKKHKFSYGFVGRATEHRRQNLADKRYETQARHGLMVNHKIQFSIPYIMLAGKQMAKNLTKRWLVKSYDTLGTSDSIPLCVCTRNWVLSPSNLPTPQTVSFMFVWRTCTDNLACYRNMLRKWWLSGWIDAMVFHWLVSSTITLLQRGGFGATWPEPKWRRTWFAESIFYESLFQIEAEWIVQMEFFSGRYIWSGGWTFFLYFSQVSHSFLN